jgi:hypothetical protein
MSYQVDKNLSADSVAQLCGATASIAIFQSLDAPATPFFSAQKLALTVAHCGYASSSKSHLTLLKPIHFHDVEIQGCFCVQRLAKSSP